MGKVNLDRPPVVKTSGRMSFFFLDGEVDGEIRPLLHKTLHINRGIDQITTWCYPLSKRMVFTYSDTKKRRDVAWRTQQVATMLNRKQLALERAILRGSIEMPPYSYSMNEQRKKSQYFWHEKNVMEAHAFFCTRHYGRPRKDGGITPKPLPTAKELRAMMRQETVMYVKDDSGEFVPVWRAPNFDQ